MTDIKRLKYILRDQLYWYKQSILKQTLPEDDENHKDSSYIYDEAWDKFSSLSRGDFEEILEILSRN
jgi:hypothetical protein